MANRHISFEVPENLNEAKALNDQMLELIE